MNGHVYFGTCTVCKKGFCYEDERIDEENLILRMYDLAKRALLPEEQEDKEERMVRVSIFEKEHTRCPFCK